MPKAQNSKLLATECKIHFQLPVKLRLHSVSDGQVGWQALDVLGFHFLQRSPNRQLPTMCLYNIIKSLNHACLPARQGYARMDGLH